MVSVEVKLILGAGERRDGAGQPHTPQGATSAADYSGAVPANLTFNTGETSKTFSLSAAQDTVDDDGESVLLTFGTNARHGTDRNDDRDRRSTSPTTTRRRSPSARAPTRSPKAAW